MEKNRIPLENQYRCVRLDILEEMIIQEEASIEWNLHRLPNPRIDFKIKESEESLKLMKDGLKNSIYNEKNRVFYIDGSCNNNNSFRVGGAGVVEVKDDKVISRSSYGPYKKVSSARMEVIGLFHVLRNLEKPDQKVVIYCDNQYVCRAIIEDWVSRWVFDYRNCGIDRKHIDLWVSIYDNIVKLRKINTSIELIWVRGHNGNRFNEIADQLANMGRTRKL